jgi:hypothetical protein
MQQITKQEEAFEQIEQVLTDGNLSALQPQQRVEYVQRLCNSVGLNPMVRPFQFIRFQNRVVLYATKSATDQLRKIHGVSIEITRNVIEDGCIVVHAKATDRDGRVDEDIAAISCERLKGEALVNARMKCVTKAKRRVTLSICGLGMLDESELDTMSGHEKISTPPPKKENTEAKEALKKKLSAPKPKPKAKEPEVIEEGAASSIAATQQFKMVWEEAPPPPGVEQ